MRRLQVLGLAAALALSGCRSRCDLVEAELRTKDRLLREANEELLFSRTMNQALECAIQQQRCTQSPVIKPGCGPSIKDIQLGRGTGGIDEDRCPGDEGIQVVLVPRDVDGSAVKIPGNLRVTAFEITTEGLKVPLAQWDVPPGELRRSWRTGLLSSGYHLALPFQRPPAFEKLRIVATFCPLEGGMYEAERDVTILLPPTAKCGGPTATIVPPIASPGAGPILTPPTPLPGRPTTPPAELLPPAPAP